MFDQCFANVWPKARQSPQTVSNGAVCFAKCKHDTLNDLILSDLLAFQRGRVLRYKYPLINLIISEISKLNLFVSLLFIAFYSGVCLSKMQYFQQKS